MKEGFNMSKKRLWTNILILFLLGVNFGACVSPRQTTENETFWPTDAWAQSSPEEQGMDSAKLNEMMAMIDDRGAPIDSVLIIRNGHIVFEQYRNGYDQQSRHHIQSVTKSFTSTLVGIAIKEGFIENVDQRLIDFYPDRTIANLDPRKQNITIEHLLTMSDGMDWHEVDLPYTHPDNSLGQMWKTDDVIQHVLDQPMLRDPGEAWNYNSGTSILLGDIIEQATGESVLVFARKYLFDPLGIGDIYWSMADWNNYHTDGGLYMVPRDMARLGYLMLKGGLWDGVQMLSPDWLSEATMAHYQTHGTYGYGYQWWMLPVSGIFAATGHYDQAIYVVPDADLVVVFTANVPDEAIHPEDGMLIRYILGACEDLPAEFTHQTYSNHGFSIEHGTEYGVLEQPGDGRDEQSNGSGAVQFHFISYPVEIINVSWDEATFGMKPGDVLENAFASMDDQERRAIELGDTVTITINNKDLYAQNITLATELIPLSGLVSVWDCAQGDRRYVISYLTDAEHTTSERYTRFKEAFESLTCDVPT